MKPKSAKVKAQPSLDAREMKQLMEREEDEEDRSEADRIKGVGYSACDPLLRLGSCWSDTSVGDTKGALDLRAVGHAGARFWEQEKQSTKFLPGLGVGGLAVSKASLEGLARVRCPRPPGSLQLI